ncbi:MAG TPA: hypothetical protein VEG32_05905 [Clostridia bacterium]|nr:hypothetical protein [Clostridia bacterium]
MRTLQSLVILLLCGVCGAQTTRTWEQTRYEELEQGTSKGVAIRSDGTLTLAPELKQLASSPSTFLWSIASDSQGNVFTAAGSPARVYRTNRDGKLTTVLAPTELQVQAVTVALDGTVYAATSPDGKVYRITPAAAAPVAKATAEPAPVAAPRSDSKVELDPAYASSVFYTPNSKYIWALAADREGRLYVATGDRGEIHRVEKNGTGSVFFNSDEAHIRTLAIDNTGNIIAGSDGSGLIYRISPRGEAFVLYSAPKKEITALAVAADGTIYAAGAGDKRSGSPATPAAASAIAPAMPAMTPGQIAPAPPAMPPGAVPALPLPGIGAAGSDVYRIAPDGSPKRLWTSREDLVYALAVHGREVLAGTGNKGKVYAIDQDGDYSNLLKASANQVIGFAPAPGGALYAATSNLGKVFVLQDSSTREATYDSDVFDAKNFSRWGRAEVRSRGRIDLLARSGNVDNPDRNWSAWRKVDLEGDARIDAPPARFLQWRAVLKPGSTAAEIDSVQVSYAARNVAPEVDDITVLPGNRFGAPRLASDLTPGAPTAPARAETAVTPTRDRDYTAIRWTARDDNDDQLTYSVFYRGEGESRWKLLKDGLADRFYSFESNLLPDGGYNLRVVASDALAHSPGEALTGERESARFEIDTTAPRIDKFKARVEGKTLRVSFEAEDATAPIRRAEFSVNGGEWKFVAPKDGISDGKEEAYEFAVPLDSDADGSGDEQLVAVRAYDRHENMSSAKVVARLLRP